MTADSFRHALRVRALARARGDRAAEIIADGRIRGAVAVIPAACPRDGCGHSRALHAAGPVAPCDARGCLCYSFGRWRPVL